jgi:hypothetical protein
LPWRYFLSCSSFFRFPNHSNPAVEKNRPPALLLFSCASFLPSLVL